jgi:hypothetical protein
MTRTDIFSLADQLYNYSMLSGKALSESKIRVSDFPTPNNYYLFGIISLEYGIPVKIVELLSNKCTQWGHAVVGKV